MPINNLGTYLNDHIAGSVVALEMMEHLEKVHANTPVGHELAEIRAEIASDRQELESFMARRAISTSPPRKVMAWLSEKLAEIKFRWDDRAAGPLHSLEALEALALGIDGKKALWHALETAHVSGIGTADLQRLIHRAEDQRARMESLRLRAAEAALQDGNETTN